MSTPGGSLLTFLLACAPEEETPVDPGVPVDPLFVPDVSAVDLPAVYAEALALALATQASPVWSAHVATLGMATPGCPDLWVGAPGDALEVDEEDGVSWADHCGGEGVGFYGAAWWETLVDVEGDPAESTGQVTTAARTLVANALVGDSTARLELDGEVSDALTRTVAPDYDRWTWSSLVTATVSGSEVDAVGAYRADMYVAVEGGDASSLEARGNLYFFEHRVDRFDSVAMDLRFVEVGGASECTLEPYGWLSLRDENAYWYDLVFLPGDGDTVDTAVDPACDGCGDLYIRGVPSGQVCLDLSAVWDGRLAPPETEDYVLSLYDLP